MANHASAEKRHRQNIRRRDRNRHARATFRTAVKRTLQAAKEGQPEEAEKYFRLSTKLIDKATIHGVLHKNNAQRRISRLARRVNTLLSAN